MNAKIISVSMPKGGVGKTATTVNVSAALSILGKKVLIVDCDPQQGNVTLSLGQNPSNLKFTISNVISSFMDLGQVIDLKDVIIELSDKIDLIPANPKLEAIQNRLIAERLNLGILEDNTSVPCHFILKYILSTIQHKYDYIIIDCPPNVSMLTINALSASNSIILPIEAHYESYEALRQMLDVITRTRAKFNPKLMIEGVLITKYQGRTKLCREMREHTEKNYGSMLHIYPDTIPLSIKVAELSGLGISIFEHEPNSEVASAYKNLAKEVILNEEK